jgi:hypothetical protein
MPVGKTEFKRNKETGILEVWRDGKKVGEIVTMGDEINGSSSDQ